MTSIIRSLIRKRKRAFRKVKLTDTPAKWLSNTLRNQRLTPKDWWTTLKTFISPLYRNSNAPLEKDEIIYSESIDKANLLNDYFRDQTLLDEQNTTLPNMPVYNGTNLSNFVITEAEVKAALLSLPLGKASGPDEINNRALQALASELSPEFVTLFNQSLQQSDVPDIGKGHMCVQFPKAETFHLFLITDRSLSLVTLIRPLKELYSNTCIITFRIMISLHHYNLALFLATPL